MELKSLLSEFLQHSDCYSSFKNYKSMIEEQLQERDSSHIVFFQFSNSS